MYITGYEGFARYDASATPYVFISGDQNEWKKDKYYQQKMAFAGTIINGTITNCSYFGLDNQNWPFNLQNILRGKGQAGYFFGGMVRNSERESSYNYDSYLTT